MDAKADIELGDRDRGKKGLPAAKIEIESVRGLWADLTNSHLQKQQLEIRVDHRSLQAQGIERAPTSHLGPAVSGMERRGMETQVGQRLEVERTQAAQQKLELAAELVAVKREQQELRVSLFELSAMAPRQRKAKTPEAAPQTAAERLVEQLQNLGKQLDIGGAHGSPSAQNETPQGGAGIDAPQSPPPVQPDSTPAVAANLSLAEQLDLLSDQVAQGLEREAQARRLAGAEVQRGRVSGRSQSPPPDSEGGRPNETAGKSIEEQIHAGADQVAQRLAQEMERDAQARAQRAEVERQRQLKVAQEKALEKQRDRGKGRSLGRSPGDDDGPKRGRDLGRGR